MPEDTSKNDDLLSSFESKIPLNDSKKNTLDKEDIMKNAESIFEKNESN